MKVSLPTLLLILFVALRLTGQIDWSWWWVLSPLWGSIVVFALLVLFFVAAGVIERRKN